MDPKFDKPVAIKLSRDLHPGPPFADCGRRPAPGTLVLWSGHHQVPRIGDVVIVAVSPNPPTHSRVTAFVVAQSYLGFVVDDQDPRTAGLYFGRDIIAQLGALSIDAGDGGVGCHVAGDGYADDWSGDPDMPAAMRELYEEVNADPTRPVAGTWQEMTFVADELLRSIIEERSECCGHHEVACAECHAYALRCSAALYLSKPQRLLFDAVMGRLRGRVTVLTVPTDVVH